MKRVLLLLTTLLFATACFQTENSSSGDGGPDLSGSPEFIAAATVMAAKCTSCHYHAYHTQTEAQLVAQGEVIPGDPENSPIYYRLIGSTGANGPKNMPQDGPLTSGEMQTIVTWINSITP